MSPVGWGLVLAAFSAMTTAAAHASVKSGNDKLAVQAWVRLIGLVIALPVAVWTGLPPRSLVPLLVAAAGLHAVYQLTLSWSYSATDFTVAYPIARGIAPIATALSAAVILRELPGTAVMISISIVSTGIIALAIGRSISRLGMAAAVMTGLLTTAYTVVDAQGMRMSPDAFKFIAWFFVLDGFSMPIAFVLLRKQDAWKQFVADWGAGIVAGIMAPVSFVPALYALSLAPIGAVAAIRETSVLIGMLIGHRILREAVDRRRLIGAALIMVGALGIIGASLH